MSLGNGGAAIGLPNTSKQAVIGGLVADAVLPTAGYPYIGENLATTWTYNAISEDPAGPFTIASCNAGKTLTWVTTGAAPVTVPADGRVTSTGGTITAAAGAGALKTFVPAGVVIPAGSYLWVESFP